MNLGGIYNDLRNFDKALASTLQSLELQSDNSYAYKKLGSIYEQLKNTAQAKESYVKAHQLKPSIENACRAQLAFPWILLNRYQVSKLVTYIKNAKRSLRMAHKHTNILKSFTVPPCIKMVKMIVCF